jgi:hypothetical protein
MAEGGQAPWQGLQLQHWSGAYGTAGPARSSARLPLVLTTTRRSSDSWSAAGPANLNGTTAMPMLLPRPRLAHARLRAPPLLMAAPPAANALVCGPLSRPGAIGRARCPSRPPPAHPRCQQQAAVSRRAPRRRRAGARPWRPRRRRARCLGGLPQGRGGTRCLATSRGGPPLPWRSPQTQTLRRQSRARPRGRARGGAGARARRGRLRLQRRRAAPCRAQTRGQAAGLQAPGAARRWAARRRPVAARPA